MMAVGLLHAYAGEQEMPGGRSSFVGLVFEGMRVERVKLSSTTDNKEAEQQAAWLVAKACKNVAGAGFSLDARDAEIGRKAVQLLLEQAKA
jgi:hypothetical protein